MRSERQRYWIFGVLALGYILVYFHRLCAAVVAVDMQRDLQAGGALLGLMAAAYFYPYALMQLPAGLLSDSLGPRRTITAFFGVACIGSLILAAAPTVAWAIVGRGLVGLGVSMLFVPTMKVLAVWFKPREFASMTGILVAVGGVGSIVASGPLARVSGALGWRSSFLIVGLVTLALAALIWLVVRDRPPEAPAPTGDAGPHLWAAVRQVLSLPAFWPLAAWFFFECAIYFAFFGLWGGPYFTHVYGLDRSRAGDLLMMGAVGMVIGSPLLSYLSNNLFKGRKPVLVLSSAGAAAIMAALCLRPATWSQPALAALCFGLGICTNAIVAIGFTAAKELFPVRIAGAATGLVNLFPFLGGALLQPFIGGLLEAHGKNGAGVFTLAGYRAALLALLCSAGLAFVASLFVRETMTRANPSGNPD